MKGGERGAHVVAARRGLLLQRALVAPREAVEGVARARQVAKELVVSVVVLVLGLLELGFDRLHLPLRGIKVE